MKDPPIRTVVGILAVVALVGVLNWGLEEIVGGVVLWRFITAKPKGGNKLT